VKALASLRRSLATINDRWEQAVWAAPMAEADVRTLEERIGALPAEYRAFVTTVSTGQTFDPDATGALLTPAAGLALELGDPRVSFAVSAADAAAIGEAVAGTRAKGAAAPALDVALDGVLALRDHGDAQYDCLVLRGPLAGTMWHAWDAGVTPIALERQAPASFLAWAAAHVKESLAAIPPPLDRGATRLTGLDLARFPSVPPAVFEMEGLEHLDLSTKPLAGPLPPGLSRLSRLRWLAISRCGVSSIDEAAVRWPELRHLDLSSNRLRSLPESIGDLGALEELLLHDNQLTSLPTSLARLRGLRRLQVGCIYTCGARAEGGNSIATLDDGSFESLTALRELRLSMTPLARLPSSVRACPLEVVELGRMPALDVTAAIAVLADIPTLRELHLYETPLAALTPALAQLPSLRSLTLIGCGLHHLPDELAALRDLERLLLDRNQLTALPDSIAAIPALRSVALFGNPLAPGEKERLAARFPALRVSA
jgi:Leucine rich repeat